LSLTVNGCEQFVEGGGEGGDPIHLQLFGYRREVYAEVTNLGQTSPRVVQPLEQ